MWLNESNRMKHFAYAIPCGFVGTELFVLGGIVGQLLQVALIILLYNI